jgi:hypothetical protein
MHRDRSTLLTTPPRLAGGCGRLATGHAPRAHSILSTTCAPAAGRSVPPATPLRGGTPEAGKVEQGRGRRDRGVSSSCAASGGGCIVWQRT